jgi:hypothetical protein
MLFPRVMVSLSLAIAYYKCIVEELTSVLARVRAFLPDFQASTTAIMQQASLDPSSVNVENVKKGERAVAMDVGLGVYDAPGAAEGMEGKGFGPVVDSDATALEGEEDEEEEDEDDEDEDEDDDEDDDMDEEEDTSDSSSSDSSNVEVDTTKTPAKSD